jgi:hypothetical protein
MATEFYELIIKGKEKVIDSFLKGYFLGRQVKKGVYLCDENHISEDPVRDIFRLKHYVHLICRTDVKKSIESAIENAPRELELKLHDERKVSRAKFSFKFEIFNKKMGTALKRLLNKPPKEVQIVGLEAAEDFNPEAKGVEMFAPLHDYSYTGEGSVEGDIEAVIQYYHKLSAIDLFNATEINLLP